MTSIGLRRPRDSLGDNRLDSTGPTGELAPPPPRSHYLSGRPPSLRGPAARTWAGRVGFLRGGKIRQVWNTLNVYHDEFIPSTGKPTFRPRCVHWTSLAASGEDTRGGRSPGFPSTPRPPGRRRISRAAGAAPRSARSFKRLPDSRV